MTNEQKAREIANLCDDCLSKCCDRIACDNRGVYHGAMQMAEWKDKQCSELIDLLLDAIDYAYLQTNGSYGDLALVVADKVEYLKNLRCGRKNSFKDKGDA